MSKSAIRLLCAIVLMLPLACFGQARQAISTPAPATCAALPFADANAAAVTVPSAADAWGGPRTGKEPTLSDRVVDYKIHATLDPDKHTIDGRQQMTWRNRSAQPVCTVYLHMYLNAFEGPGSTFMREQSNNGFSFRSDVKVKAGDWGYIELKRVQQSGQ
ncbi:MAG: M1 family peptidase, partial [Luteimonas sp.]|nr:M1 family peptidase [Luteimonas sp.]